MTTNAIIGKNLKSYREINGFTQDSIANLLNVKREMISYYESGAREIPFNTLNTLSDLFEIELADFYEENDLVAKQNMAIAFRKDCFDDNDLDAIAQFKGIVKSYIKLNKLLETV